MKKWTQKQLAVLRRIIKREQRYYDSAAQKAQTEPKRAGVHPSGRRFVITDGAVAVILSEPPEAFPIVEGMDRLDQIVFDYCSSRSYRLESIPSVEDTKEIIGIWKRKKNLGKPQIPTFFLSAEDSYASTVSGHFNAQFYADALEAAGTHCSAYLVRGRFTSYPALMLYREEKRTDAVDYEEPVLLMPCRPDK